MIKDPYVAKCPPLDILVGSVCGRLKEGDRFSCPQCFTVTAIVAYCNGGQK